MSLGSLKENTTKDITPSLSLRILYMSSKCIIVLGMHRSATSLVSKGLSTQISMGPLGTSRMLDVPMSDNPQGHFENLDFVHLNDAILKAAGGWWGSPPSREKILAVIPQFSDEVAKVIARNRKLLWGFKDPRTVLTLDHYTPHIESLHVVAVFRDPDEVARSLSTRNPKLFSHESAKCLANYYNKQTHDHLSRLYIPESL